MDRPDLTDAASERTGTIRRNDESPVFSIEANVAPGLLVNDQINALQAPLTAADLPEGATDYEFAGEAEDQAETMTSLVDAFVAVIFLMLVILVLQFNAYSQAFVVMSAIVFSIAGVLLGLLITAVPSA